MNAGLLRFGEALVIGNKYAVLFAEAKDHPPPA
jgi:hypothetical protein